MPIDAGIYNRRSPIGPVDVEAILGPDPTQQRQTGSPALESSRVLAFQKQQREQQLAAQYGDDPETFIKEMSRVDPEKSESYRRTWQEGLTASANRHKAEVGKQKAYIDLAVNMMQGANETTGPVIRKMILSADPNLAPIIPETFDEASIGQFVQIGRTANEFLNAQDRAADKLAEGKTQEAFYQLIAGASNPQQFEAAKELAAKARLTPYLKMLGDRPWSPELQQEALTKAMDPKDQYGVAHPEAAPTKAGTQGSIDDLISTWTQEHGRRPTYAEKLKILNDKEKQNDKPVIAGGGSSSNGLPTEYANALDRAILAIPAVRRPAIVNLANRLAKAGDLDGLRDVIRQAAIDTENVDTKKQIVGRQATLASLRDTRAILQEMQAKGVPTNMFVGTVEDMARKLGTSTNPEYVELANRLMGTLINYRRSATGVQFSARESADYQKMFPNYRNTLPVNLALITGLEREMHTYDKTYWEHKLGKKGAELIIAPPASSGAGADGAPPVTGPLKWDRVTKKWIRGQSSSAGAAITAAKAGKVR